MRFEYLLLDVVFILFLVAGFLLIPVLQVAISSRHVQRLTKKVGPNYWGSLYAGDSIEVSEQTIALYPPCRDTQSNYGKQA